MLFYDFPIWASARVRYGRNHMVDAVDAGRRRFGTVITRKRKDGTVGSWLARYSSPVDGRRVQRSFGSSHEAEVWLHDEEMLVTLHKRGVQEWIHPTDRDRRRQDETMTFDELADWYVETHRKPDGTALRGAARRNLRTDVGHLKDVFGGMTLTQITPDVVSKWYFGPHDEGEWVFPRMCQRLKAIMGLACSDKFGTGMPLLESNPFTLPIPPDPEPKSWDVPPLTGPQLAALYESMPKYDRLAVLLAAWTGGMRIGEACALKVSDFNLEARTMMVNHSVCRNDDDLGTVRLGPTKSKHSRRVCALPDLLVPLVREHIANRRDGSSPYMFQTRAGGLLSPSTLGNHFRQAREQAGCPTATFRTLRVTHTTLLMQNGGTVREAMDSIGDSTQEVVMRHYTRTVHEHQRQVVNRMASGMASESADLQRILGVEHDLPSGPRGPVASRDGGGDITDLANQLVRLLTAVGSMPGEMSVAI